MRHPLSRRGLGALAALALPLMLGSAGCHTFKYVDMTVSFDQGAFDDMDILTIARCRMLVSGADTDDFILKDCPNPNIPDPHVGPVFEFSTFADSGTLHFEFKGFQGMVDSPACLVADGKTDVAVTSLTTIPATLNVTTKSAGCNTNVSPLTDGGP